MELKNKIKRIYEKGELLYEGKAKKVYKLRIQNEDSIETSTGSQFFSKAQINKFLWLEFKDSLTAFNAQKKGSFSDKGVVNKKITSIIFRYLKDNGIPSHWVEDISEREMICHDLKIIPLEVVVRNWLAGSTAKKFEIEEGTVLDHPLVEFYYKKDELNDPFVSDDQALMLKAVEKKEVLEELKIKALAINQLLLYFFSEIGIRLVDFKIEFGFDHTGLILLGDEITPDSCRLWDINTKEKLDKDRFRRDLGKVAESYLEVLKRMTERWEKK